MTPEYHNQLQITSEHQIIPKNVNKENLEFENIIKPIVKDKIGLEIGGPSTSTGKTIYINAERMDNVIFSKNTLWSKHDDTYNYYDNKKGYLFINDGINIKDVKNGKYDFCFASHCLEHIANPLKAIKEWLRTIKINGYIILILPEKSKTFDHKRNISSFSTLLSQYKKNVGEDDLSTLDEILEKHDLTLDPPAGTFDQFKKRSLDNFNNRSLHHYVYDANLLNKICEFFKCKFIYTETNGLDIWYIMKKIRNT